MNAKNIIYFGILIVFYIASVSSSEKEVGDDLGASNSIGIVIIFVNLLCYRLLKNVFVD